MEKKPKEKIFEAAVKVFAEKGFDGASIRRIAKEAGMAPSSLYNHFPSKEKILEEVHGRFQSQTVSPVMEKYTIDRESLLRLGLPAFLEKLVSLGEEIETTGTGELLGKIIALEKNRNPTASGIAYGNKLRFVVFMKNIFEQVTETGFNLKIDPETAAWIFTEALAGLAGDYPFFSFQDASGRGEYRSKRKRLIASLCILLERENSNG